MKPCIRKSMHRSELEASIQAIRFELQEEDTMRVCAA
jgi:hypothetical protein